MSNFMTPTLGIDISVGDHVQRKIFGLTVNLDIVWATCIAGVIVITLGLILRAKATSGVPGKFQLAWEMAVGAVQTQVDDSIGPQGAKVSAVDLHNSEPPKETGFIRRPSL